MLLWFINSIVVERNLDKGLKKIMIKMKVI